MQSVFVLVGYIRILNVFCKNRIFSWPITKVLCSMIAMEVGFFHEKTGTMVVVGGVMVYAFLSYLEERGYLGVLTYFSSSDQHVRVC